MKQNIFDSSNKVIGFLLEVGTQTQVYDKDSRLLGYYNKLNDTTYKNNCYFGRGDQTTRLLN